MPDHTVRTTFRPDVELVVGDAELADLTAQGLLVDGDVLVTKADLTQTPAASPATGKSTEKKG